MKKRVLAGLLAMLMASCSVVAVSANEADVPGIFSKETETPAWSVSGNPKHAVETGGEENQDDTEILRGNSKDNPSGDCSADQDGSMTWQLTGTDMDMTLTISCNGEKGEMKAYDDNTLPWGPWRNSIKTVIIGEGVENISEYAFKKCTSLTSITLPTTFRETRYQSFSGCINLHEIRIAALKPWMKLGYGDGLKGRSYTLYLNDEPVTALTIPNPEGDTDIDESSFINCTSLTSVWIPDGITSIGIDAFSRCSNLTSIRIPETVTTIGPYALDGCSSLTSIDIPADVTSIGSFAFSGCSSLTGITIPAGVTSIGNNVFNGCTKLESIFFRGSEAQWDAIEKDNIGYDGTVYFIVNPVTGIKLKRTTATIFTTATLSLITEISPDNASLKEVTWTSSNEKVATVDDGVVTAKAVGKTVITATTLDGGYQATCTVTVKKATVSGIKNRTYTGSGRSQSPTVTLTDGGATTTLELGTDYTLKYENNVEVGIATVKIVGKGSYTGTITKTFQIVHGKPVLKSAVNAAGGIQVTWGAVTGATKYRVYRKTATGNFAKLADTSDVTYLDKTAKAGIKYFYTVRCLSADGTKTTSSYDTEGKMGVYVPQPAMSSLTSPKAGQILPKWGRFSGIDGYQIQYSQSKTFASGNKSATATGAATGSKTISGLTSGKTYYVRVRTYKKLDGKNYYSAWSAVKSVKVK